MALLYFHYIYIDGTNNSKLTIRELFLCKAFFSKNPLQKNDQIQSL